MIELAKFLHFVGLMLGGGAGFASMVVARHMRANSGQPTPQLAALRPALARVALGGVLLLWVSGLWMFFSAWRGAQLGPAFHAKMAVATLLVLVVAAINVVGMRARARGVPPPVWLPMLGMATPVLALVAVALAIAVFG
jgi:hypothetical protein